MPAIFGAPRDVEEGTLYRDVLSLSVTYAAPAEKIESLLPEKFRVGAEPASEPLVTVYYARNRNVDWLAGGGYNLLGLDVAATYCGERDRVSGNYCVILWENMTEPILAGREIAGVPKVHADITDPMWDGQRLWVRASKNGRPIVEVELADLQPYNEEQVKQFQESARRGNWMGWRYIPRIGGPGAEISQATVFPSSSEYRSVDSAKGTVRFFPSNFAENPTQYRLINLLCELKALEYRWAFRTQGAIRLLPGQVRVLR